MKTYDSCFGAILIAAAIISVACSSPTPTCPSGCDCTTPNAAMAPCKTDLTVCQTNVPHFGVCDNGNEVKKFPTGCKAATEQWWDGSTYAVSTNCQGMSSQCYREWTCYYEPEGLGSCEYWASAEAPGGNWKSGNKWYADCCDDD